MLTDSSKKSTQKQSAEVIERGVKALHDDFDMKEEEVFAEERGCNDIEAREEGTRQRGGARGGSGEGQCPASAFLRTIVGGGRRPKY